VFFLETDEVMPSEGEIEKRFENLLVSLSHDIVPDDRTRFAKPCFPDVTNQDNFKC
jgi:hypothetical protein